MTRVPPRLIWRWAVLAVIPLLLFPQIDIAASALFFDPVHQTFWLRSHPVGEFVRKQLPALLFVLAALVALAGGIAWRRGSAVLGVTWRGAALVLSCLALGPGVVVNLVLKDNWGRPRPSTIAEFGGPHTYVPPLVPSDQCLDNCSFSSGHAALGFWVVSLALLAPPRWRSVCVAAALAFGVMMGFVRIAQGGHFVSDVAFSGLIVVGLAYGLHNLIVERSGLTALEK